MAAITSCFADTAAALRGLDGMPGRLPPHPLAHQQAALPPYDAKKVDAWAMGVVLYLLVTGTYPFEVSIALGHWHSPPFYVTSSTSCVVAVILHQHISSNTRMWKVAEEVAVACDSVLRAQLTAWVVHQAAARCQQQLALVLG